MFEGGGEGEGRGERKARCTGNNSGEEETKGGRRGWRVRVVNQKRRS